MSIILILTVTIIKAERILPEFGELETGKFYDMLKKIQPFIILFVVLTTVIAFLAVFSSVLCVVYGIYQNQKRKEKVETEFRLMMVEIASFEKNANESIDYSDTTVADGTKNMDKGFATLGGFDEFGNAVDGSSSITSGNRDSNDNDGFNSSGKDSSFVAEESMSCGVEGGSESKSGSWSVHRSKGNGSVTGSGKYSGNDKSGDESGRRSKGEDKIDSEHKSRSASKSESKGNSNSCSVHKRKHRSRSGSKNMSKGMNKEGRRLSRNKNNNGKRNESKIGSPDSNNMKSGYGDADETSDVDETTNMKEVETPSQAQSQAQQQPLRSDESDFPLLQVEYASVEPSAYTVKDRKGEKEREEGEDEGEEAQGKVRAKSPPPSELSARKSLYGAKESGREKGKKKDNELEKKKESEIEKKEDDQLLSETEINHWEEQVEESEIFY